MKRAWISSIIAGTLLLQGFLVLPTPIRRSILTPVVGYERAGYLNPPLTFPFLDYPLYTNTHETGEPIPQLRLIGIRADGFEEQLSAEGLGMTPWHFNFLIRAAVRSDVTEVRDCLDAIDSPSADALVGLRVEDEPVLWGDGPVRRGPVVTVETLSLREP